MTFDERTRLWIPERAPAVHTIRNTELELRAETKVQGWWRWELLNRGGEVVRQNGLGWQKNLVVNDGLDRCFSGPSYAYCGVGTNNAPPAVTQSQLGAQLGGRISNNGGFSSVNNTNVSNTYSQEIRTWLFDFNEANGNLTEVGLFASSTGTPMHMRQLFLDETSTPTVVVKTSEFQLKIVYDWRVYWYPTTDEVYTATVNGASRNVLQRRGANTQWAQGVTLGLGPDMGASSYQYLWTAGSTFGSAGQAVSGGTQTSNDGTGVTPNYQTGTYQHDYDARWSASIANGATYSYAVLSLYNTQYYPIKVDLTNQGESPGFTKNNTQRFILTFRRSWSRYP